MQYLSDAWIEAADEAVRTATIPAPAELVIDQHVDGAGSWRVTIGERPSLTRLPAEVGDASPTSADATFRQSVGTARAIAQGETDAHQAFLLGRITFDGDIERLIECRDALTWLQARLVPVMERTVWQ